MELRRVSTQDFPKTILSLNMHASKVGEIGWRNTYVIDFIPLFTTVILFIIKMSDSVDQTNERRRSSTSPQETIADIERQGQTSKSNEKQDDGNATRDVNLTEKKSTPSIHQVEGHNAFYTIHNDGTKLLTFGGESDKDNPRNWSKSQKWYLTFLCSYINVLVASQASVYSTGQAQIENEFGISEELAIAGLSLYVLGFAIGPMIFAPLSETFGRRMIYVVCWFLFVVLQFGVAFAPNIPVLFVFRFLTGFFSSPPLANTGGVISDLWGRDESGPAMAVYVVGSTCGPQIGNIYAGFIAQKLGWRWVFYLTSLLIMGVHWFILLFTLKETRHNIILKNKVNKIKKATGDNSFVSVHEDERKSMFTLFKTSLSRPIYFLCTEPITMFAALWNGLLYGLIFLFNDAFNSVFGPESEYAFKHSGVLQITFVSFVIGEFIGFGFYFFTQEPFYQRKIKQAGQSVPEARMASGTIGCCLLPIGLFIFAWTCYPSISPVVPLIGAAIFGIGFFQVLYGIMSWTVDAYREYAASALGAVVLVRNLFGAGLPLAGAPMYKK